MEGGRKGERRGGRDDEDLHIQSLPLTHRYNIMQSCWSVKPEERPSFSALIQQFQEIAATSKVSLPHPLTLHLHILHTYTYTHRTPCTPSPASPHSLTSFTGPPSHLHTQTLHTHTQHIYIYLYIGPSHPHIFTHTPSTGSPITHHLSPYPHHKPKSQTHLTLKRAEVPRKTTSHVCSKEYLSRGTPHRLTVPR